MPLINVNEQEWIQYIGSRQDAIIFHHPAWVGLLTVCYGYKPYYLAIQNGQDQIIGGLPILKISSWLTGRRATSLPFTDFCPPLADDEAALNKLVQALQDFRHQEKETRIEVHWPLPDQACVFKSESFGRSITRLSPDPEEVYGRFKRKSVVTSITQSIKAGVNIVRGESWSDLNLFYRMHLETRRRLGTPVQPLKFFKLLWEKILSQGFGFLLLAYKDGVVIAGGVFLCWNKTLIYKYGASDSRYWNLRPNNLLIWHAIKWGCEQGYTVFDWGKTELDNEGLMSFKRHWGSEESIVNYSILDDHPPGPSKMGMSRSILARVIQHSPSFVCRAVGELLYGHFA